MNNPGGIAGLGRGEDTMLAHVAPGEMVVPPVISPQTQQIIQQEMMAVGLDPNEYTVGQGMSINPITGMAEFGFLKKLGKSLKKIVKKVAPVAGALLIPGVGGVLGKGLGAIGSKLGIKAGIGSKLLGGKGILDTAAAVRGGIGGLFGMGGGQPALTQEQMAELSPEELAAYQQAMNTGPFGGQFGPFLRDTFLGTAENPGLLRNIGSGIGIGDGGGLGGNAGLMALAALYGKAVKEDFKEKEGGLKDIRQSIRPDLMPQQTFQGFDLGIRKPAAMGGLQELDMRMGGPSIGPGTGTSDDIPAMLSDGEFVMTSAANNGLGGFKVTKTETGIEIMPSGKPDRQKGAKNMDRLMKMFEQYNDIGKV